MDQSLLSTLPRELRDHIYGLALKKDDPVRIEYGDPPLSFTCRQIREECLLMYYEINNHMKLCIPFASSLNVDQKLASIASLGKLKHLERLFVVVQCGGYHASRVDETGMRSQKMCAKVANVLAYRMGLSYEKVEWICVGGGGKRCKRPSSKARY